VMGAPGAGGAVAVAVAPITSAATAVAINRQLSMRRMSPSPAVHSSSHSPPGSSGGGRGASPHATAVTVGGTHYPSLPSVTGGGDPTAGIYPRVPARGLAGPSAAMPRGYDAGGRPPPTAMGTTGRGPVDEDPGFAYGNPIGNQRY
jgi:hypothetical protein